MIPLKLVLGYQCTKCAKSCQIDYLWQRNGLFLLQTRGVQQERVFLKDLRASDYDPG
jgi:hypothetical protein